jgi:hypothetical protein
VSIWNGSPRLIEQLTHIGVCVFVTMDVSDVFLAVSGLDLTSKILLM